MTRARHVLAVVVLAGCGAAQRPSSGAGGPARAADYLPLHAGAAWSYDTETGIGGDTVLNVIAVEHADGTHFVVRSGTRREPYEVRDDGIARDGEYLIRDPVRAGATWQGHEGASVEIRSAAPSRQIGERTYRDVIEVHRVSPRTHLETTTWYARGVGAIEIVGETVSSLGGHLRVRSTLRGFTRGDDVEGDAPR